MKATKKIGLVICATGILLAGIAVAQTSTTTTSDTSPKNAATATSTTSDTTGAATTASTGNSDSWSDLTAVVDTDGDTSELVMVIESEGDLDEVAEAISQTDTDTLVASIPEGVTIFAPVDGSFGQGVVVEDVITSYIVPGIIDTTDLASNSSTTSTSISGQPVTIAVVEEVVTVNGVPVMDAEAIYTGNAVIYKLSDSFATNDLASTK